MKPKKRPDQIPNLHEVILACIVDGRYTQTKHAIQRGSERDIDIPDAIHVLKTGRHEKVKTTFDEHYGTWKYAIRGETIDGLDVRVIIAFDDEGMLIITVIKVERGGMKYER